MAIDPAILRKIRMLSLTLEDIEDITHLGSEGMTRCAHHLLQEMEVQHKVFAGSITCRGTTVTPHFWIQVGEVIVDYRIRSIFGAKCPHGIFPLWEDSNLRYRGFVIQLTTGEELYNVLIQQPAREMPENATEAVSTAIDPPKEENARERRCGNEATINPLLASENALCRPLVTPQTAIERLALSRKTLFG